MFIGEAPGRDEDNRGVPFVGRAGMVLSRVLRLQGIGRSEVYVTNLVKCRPTDNDGKNRQPDAQEQLNCYNAWLEKEIEVVDPYVIGLLGFIPTRFFLGHRSMTQLVGVAKHRIIGSWDGVLMGCYHPAATLYRPGLKAAFYSNIERVFSLAQKRREEYPKRRDRIE
jgi:DNA polymerase